MLNTNSFTLLAGDPSAWDAEMLAGDGQWPWNDNGLCRVQEEQHARGRRSAELVPTIYGWSVRLASGLDREQLLFGFHKGNGFLKRDAAIALGTAWAEEDPLNREFYTRNMTPAGIAQWDQYVTE